MMLNSGRASLIAASRPPQPTVILTTNHPAALLHLPAGHSPQRHAAPQGTSPAPQAFSAALLAWRTFLFALCPLCTHGVTS